MSSIKIEPQEMDFEITSDSDLSLFEPEILTVKKEEALDVPDVHSDPVKNIIYGNARKADFGFSESEIPIIKNEEPIHFVDVHSGYYMKEESDEDFSIIENGDVASRSSKIFEVKPKDPLDTINVTSEYDDRKSIPTAVARPLGGYSIRLSGRHSIRPLPMRDTVNKRKRRKCLVCAHTTTRQPQRRDTQFECSKCQVALCPYPCFDQFHSLDKF